MRRCVEYPIVITVLLLTCSLCVPMTLAQSSSEDNVETTLTCSFVSGSQLAVQAQMIVNSIDVFDTRYTRQAIEEMTSSNQIIMGAIMLRLHDSVKAQIETAFANADVDTMNTIPTYEKPYFIDTFRVNLTAAFFRYNGSLNLTDFINGVLDMGATVAYSFDLSAAHGWNTSFVFSLPSTMTLVYANTADTNPETNTVQWVVRNSTGTDGGIDATISMQSKNPTTTVSETQDISLEYIFDTRTVTDITFIDSMILRKVDIRNYNVLPAFVTGLGSIPADGLRLFIENGLFTWENFFENTIHPIEQQTTPLLENSSFQQNLSLSFSWDAESTTNCSTPYDIAHMDDEPAIRVNFEDSDIDLRICEMPARAFLGLINAGANASIASEDVNFGARLDGIMYPYTIMLLLPNNITLDGQTRYLWNKTTPISGAFTSDVQPSPPYSTDHIETYIVIELAKMDLNIPSVFSGKTELTASMKMREDDNLYVIRRSDDLWLSPKLNISFLNADAFRLCVNENVFSEGQITAFLSQKTALFQQRLSDVFNGLKVKGTIDRTSYQNSLGWDGDISTMDDVVSVVVSNYANEVHMVGFNVSLWPADLSVRPQQFTLQGIANQTVTYRIIFPRGIDINASEDTGRPLIIGTTNDGRDYVELSFNGSVTGQPSVLTCVLSASPVYVLGLFLPCILVFLLLVVLIVIIYLIRKKRGGLRRGKRKLFEPEDNEPSDYSGQEYYVPPPPSSTKKKK
ncbi:MAG: hypothetical protein NTY91_05025 [Euryarchaeota archaeon]|nr:hypothetical protein [Euryarchaeota archaeon]